MRETFIKRCIVERTTKAEIRPEEQSEKSREFWGEFMEWTTVERAIRQNRYMNRIKRSGQALLVYVKDIYRNTPTTRRWWDWWHNPLHHVILSGASGSVPCYLKVYASSHHHSATPLVSASQTIVPNLTHGTWWQRPSGHSSNANGTREKWIGSETLTEFCKQIRSKQSFWTLW